MNKPVKVALLGALALSALGLGAHYPTPQHYTAQRVPTCLEQLNRAGYWPTDSGPVSRAFAGEALTEYWQILNNCHPDTMTEKQIIDSYENLHVDSK